MLTSFKLHFKIIYLIELLKDSGGLMAKDCGPHIAKWII